MLRRGRPPKLNRRENYPCVCYVEIQLPGGKTVSRMVGVAFNSLDRQNLQGQFRNGLGHWSQNFRSTFTAVFHSESLTT